MKKITLLTFALAAIYACEELPDQGYLPGTSPVKINVGLTQTKGLVTTNGLPESSELGTFFFDESNSTYDLMNYKNVKFAATGEGDSQVWTPERTVRASSTKGTMYAYYPYSSSVTQVNEIPVSATAKNQIDYMWATPATAIDYVNSSVNLNMNHALAAIKFSIKKGGYTGTGELTKIYIAGDNLAQSAVMDATTGKLSNYEKTGETIIHSFDALTLSETPVTLEYIVVPVEGVEDNINVAVVIDGATYAIELPKTAIEQNVIYEYSLSVTSDISVTKVTVSSWESSKHEPEIMIESTQPITAKIKHVDGTLYSAEQWTAALEDGKVTNDQVVGVAVPHHENPLEFLCVIHPTAQKRNLIWSSNITVKINADDDYNGQANTDIILAAVAAGTIEDAPAAQYCASITFADGKKGYLPARYEITQIQRNCYDVNECLKACGGVLMPSYPEHPYCQTWSSTEISEGRAFYVGFGSSIEGMGAAKNTSLDAWGDWETETRAVCAF